MYNPRQTRSCTEIHMKVHHPEEHHRCIERVLYTTECANWEYEGAWCPFMGAFHVTFPLILSETKFE